jgi:hypothetical protein
MLYQLSYTPKGSEMRGISSCPADGKGQLIVTPKAPLGYGMKNKSGLL